MTGVEILSTTEVAIDFAFNWKMALITFGILFVIAVAIGILVSFISEDWSQVVVGIFAGCVWGVLSAGLVGMVLETPTAYEERYKVIISDEVSMTEFVNTYEILSQEGKIYTVRERE